MSEEKILVVENSLEDRDLIARQALKTLGYNVRTAELASTGIQLALTFQPDLILTNLSLPDLSGKDLLVALKAQNIETPVVLIANRGHEQDVAQAFRLGATDVINKPLREAEVVATVERAIQNVRTHKEKEQVARRLREENGELRDQIRSLSALVALARAVTSAGNPQDLFKSLVDGAVRVAAAERAYLLTRADKNQFHLVAYKNLPKSLSKFLNRSFDDGISALAARSGKSMTMHGDALKRFKISQLGKAVLVAPIRVQQEVVGMLVCMRTENNPYNRTEQKLLESAAEFAAFSMVHGRRVRAYEEQADRLNHALQLARESAGEDHD